MPEDIIFFDIKKMHNRVLFFIILILIIILILKYYWKIQLLFNSSGVSLYTPESFKIPDDLKDVHKRNVKNGFDIAKNKKVVFAVLLRDKEERIPEIIKKVERMGNLFNAYAVLIVENDSSDNTRDALLQWSKKNNRVTILGCGYNVKRCSVPMATKKTEGHSIDRARIDKMSILRNIYLDEIAKNYSNYDYTIVWDLDVIGSVYLDGVAHSINYLDKNKNTDLVCAYGIYNYGVFTLYYDTYGHLAKGEKSSHIDMKTPHDIRTGLWEVKYNRGDDPVEVDSCFSGFSIYQTSSILDARHEISPKNNIECEHVVLNRKLKRKVMNPSMINVILENT